MAPPLSMALPYAAAQFSAALSGRPEVGQQANESLALNRALQLQKRSQILDQLANQSAEAARRAEAAGNLTESLKFNTKANLYMKQLDESMTGIREAKKTAEDQAFDAWRTMYNARAEYLSRLVSSGSTQNPALAARLSALKEGFEASTRALQERVKLTPPKDQPALQQALTDLQSEYMKQTELAIGGAPIYQPPPPAPPAPPPAPAPPPGGSVRAVGRFFRSGSEKRQEATDFLDRNFSGMTRAEIIAALREQAPGGKTKGRLLADKYGIDFFQLMSAARRIRDIGPEPGPAPPRPIRSVPARLRSGAF